MRVADVAAYVSNGFINVAVGNGEVQKTVEIGVEERAAEAQRVARRSPDAGWNGHIVENSWGGSAIETDHFVVEIGDGHTGLARTIEISRVDAHAGACFSFRAERQTGLHRNVLKLPVLQITVQLIGLRIIGHQQIRPAVLIVVEHRHSQGF